MILPKAKLDRVNLAIARSVVLVKATVIIIIGYDCKTFIVQATN
jgi:hypothetical protein